MWLLLEIKASCTVAAIQWPLIVVMKILYILKEIKLILVLHTFNKPCNAVVGIRS